MKSTGTEALVCEDIAHRQWLGIEKYKTTVADNPLSLREWLQHAYEECLDQAIYLKRAMEEIPEEGHPFNKPITDSRLREFHKSQQDVTKETFVEKESQRRIVKYTITTNFNDREWFIEHSPKSSYLYNIRQSEIEGLFNADYMPVE